MGKTRKNQPGYTQGKDKNGRTIWVPDGSQSASPSEKNAHNALSDFPSTDMEDNYDDIRQVHYDDAESDVHDIFFANDLIDDNLSFDRSIESINEYIATEYADEQMDGNNRTYEDIASDMPDVSLDFTTEDNVFANQANKKTIEKYFASDFSVDRYDNTVSIPISELVKRDNITLQRLLGYVSVVKNHVSMDDKTTEAVLQEAVSRQAREADIDRYISSYLEQEYSPQDYEEYEDYEDHLQERRSDLSGIDHYSLEDYIMDNTEKYVDVSDGSIDVDRALADMVYNA